MKRGKRGFTLAEMLLVVGILVVLLAAAIPGIVAIQKRLEMRRLDDYAREIFVEAQNQLMARSIIGDAAEVDAQADREGDYSWLADNAAVKVLLAGDAADILEAGCHCVLKYNPSTATVLEVYYALGSADLAQVKAGAYSGGENAALRRELKIGYFSGGDADGGRVGRMPAPTLSIDNGEELTVTVALAPSGSFGAAACRLTVTVHELDGAGNAVPGRSFQLASEGNIPLATGMEKAYLLDSLLPGQRFYELAAGKVTPGADLLVTAQVSMSSGQSTAYLASSASYKTNSLFASASGGTVRVANGRHLQNLDYGSSRVRGAAAAVQADTVSWGSTQSYYAEKYPQTYTSSAPLTFSPINTNSTLKNYNGQNNEIQGLYILLSGDGSVGKDAGLFASVSGGELKNIRLSNIRCFNEPPSASAATGTLAGRLTDTAVSNCGAYSYGSTVYGNTTYVGGLAGSVTGGSLTNCYVGVNSVATEFGSTVGGLVGYANGVTITRSYANAGLLRKNSDSNWVNSSDNGYYGCGLASGGHYAQDKQAGDVGGIVGMGVNGTSVSLSYACGHVYIASTACGIFGPETDSTCRATDSYSVLSYFNKVKNSYGLSYRDICSNCCFWSGGNVDYGTGVTATAILGWASAEWDSQGVTEPYNVGVISAPYPYPMVRDLTHYGDWPAPGQIETDALVFYRQLPAGGYTPYTSGYVSVEQIPGDNTEQIIYNQKQLTAYASGAGAASAVVWQANVNGTWVTINDRNAGGSGDGLRIRDGAGKVRATLHRDKNDNSYDGHSTGGSLTVRGVNVNEFDTAFTMQLRVRSVLSTNDNDWRTVALRVMPQLSISPAAATETANFTELFGGPKYVTFTANRSDSEYGWTYLWSDSGGLSADHTSRAYISKIDVREVGSFLIGLTWGPYSATATLITRDGAAGPVVSTCTNDGTGGGRYYFIIEKGKTRQMVFSWSGLRALGSVSSEALSIPSAFVTMTPGTKKNGNSGAWPYTVSGDEYTDGAPETASWKATQSGLNSSTSTTECDIYVVGLEPASEETLTAPRGGGELSFSALAHFPTEAVVPGERRFSWSVDSNEYISLGAPVTAGNTSTVAAVPLKANVSGEDVSVNLYCTFSVTGTGFGYTQVFTAVIPSMAEPEIVPCTLGDLAFLGGFDPAPTEGDWMNARLSGTAWRVIEGTTVYLKTKNAVDAGHAVSIETAGADVSVSCLKSGDNVVYYRIKAPGAAGSTAAATVRVGCWSGELSFNIIARPALAVAACTLEEANAAFPTLSLAEQTWPAEMADGCWQSTAGGRIFLKVTGTPDLQGFELAGADGAYMTLTTAYLGDAAYICIDTLWPDSDAGASKDLVLTLSIPDASLAQPIRINKPVPQSQPESQPAASPTPVASPGPAPVAEPAPAA